MIVAKTYIKTIPKSCFRCELIRERDSEFLGTTYRCGVTDDDIEYLCNYEGKILKEYKPDSCPLLKVNKKNVGEKNKSKRGGLCQ